MPPIVDDARRRGSVAVALLVALVSASCGGHVTAPTPPPDPISQVTPIDGNGPIRITFVSANVSPGTVVAGCGDLIEGCAGRLRLTFRSSRRQMALCFYTT